VSRAAGCFRALLATLAAAAVMLPASDARPTPVMAAAPKLTVAVIGDYGCQSGSNCRASGSNEIAVANLVHSWKPDSIVTVGDNSYEDGNAAAVVADQAPYAADIAAGRFYPTPGNHDWLNGSIEPSTNVFRRPPHYVANLGEGLVDLFVTDMNSQDPDGDSATSRQADQYRADVAASKAIWKITTDHQAFYSSGEHGSNDYTHWAILPQVDLFLSGHDHDFEHLVVDGKHFVVNGVGGRNRYPVCANGCIEGSVWHDDQNFGAVRLTVTPATLLVEYITVDGQVVHSFQLTKGGEAAAGGQSSSTNAPPQPTAGGDAREAKVPGASVQLPIRAAFYYPWFPESWSQQGMNPFTRYHPNAGFYDSSAASTVKAQIEQMQYARMDAGIASWWGRQTPTDSRIPQLMKLGADSRFHWALLYEQEGQGDPSSSQIGSDLRYVRTHYASNSAYLRVDGRFVVFAYADPKDGCSMAARWRQAKQIGAYVMLKVFPGYRSCKDQPDGWYQYSPEVSSVAAQDSMTISPGFWKASENNSRLSRNVDRWRGDVRAMVASKADFQLITSFNEWGEGTAIEPAREWSDGSSAGPYVQALHDEIPSRVRGHPSAAAFPPPLFWVISAPTLLLALLLGVVLARSRVRLHLTGGGNGRSAS
jgi:calcineurin-like phosphoesterase family protein